ncbi:hypothetical protein [Paraburkholderia hospita]|uniref:hypothetical protein n=1 Tax=Paraburkholderia hospita TaxID=169430 RepID=UPI0008A74D77|nr:hypothetical protein [Paraburkholderia hospita]SEH89090.1 hypothetical protein SAMN05192544_101198 [Paraburkholderia hospita]
MNKPENATPPEWMDHAALEAARELYTHCQMVPPERTAQIVARMQIALVAAMQYGIAKTDAETSALSLQVSMERSRAIEWGGYLVTAAESLIDGVNVLAELDMKIDDGEEVDSDEHAHAREVLSERMRHVRERIYDFNRKVAEGTRNIDRHAQPAKLDDETVATIRAFMDRPGETYRNGVASLGYGFGLALAKRIREVSAHREEERKAAQVPDELRGAVMECSNVLSMSEHFPLVRISRDSLSRVYGAYVSDQARNAIAVEHFNQLRPLRDALGHIERTAQRSREQSRRLRWIELRARGALTGTDEWRTVELPKNGEPSKRRLKHEISELHALVPHISPAVRAILAERHRQITVEGFSPERDAQFVKFDLAFAGAAYAVSSTKGQNHPRSMVPGTWPWEASWWKPSTPERNLEKAGALIIAELERRHAARCTVCNGSGWYVVEGPTSEADGHHPNMEQCDCVAERAAEERPA